MAKPVLIFPGGMPRSLDFLQQCLRQKRPAIGASSLGYDAAQVRFPAWVRLPYVTDPGFDAALREVVAEHGIGEIYTPNIVVWNHLNQTLGEMGIDVVLANISPVDEALDPYRAALAKSRHFIADHYKMESDTPAAAWLSEIELAGLIRYADGIPGMCDDFKLRALVEIARYAVPGDVVEIGTWWGKSAFILQRLAHCHGIGKLLCVDPWANELLKQDEKLVDSGSEQVDANEALEIFQIGLVPFNINHINYLRMPSVAAAARYRIGGPVCSAAFGITDYAGRISILHIDGNHAYESASADVEAWSGLVGGGGWIIIDDYLWPYGDGPRRAGDEFLAANWNRISTAFVSGSALFIRLVLADAATSVKN